MKEVGIYPPGDLVKLKSGEHAVVVRRTGNASLPMVASITDRGGHAGGQHRRARHQSPQIRDRVDDQREGGTTMLRMAPEHLYGLQE